MDNYINTDGAMSVIIGGKLWPVPVLAARQNKIIDPLILGLLPIFAQWQDNREEALKKIGREQYDALLEISFVAISCIHRDLSREQFLDLPVTLPELIAAFSIIAQQTGVFQKSSGEDAVPGEAAGV